MAQKMALADVENQGRLQAAEAAASGNLQVARANAASERYKADMEARARVGAAREVASAQKSRSFWGGVGDFLGRLAGRTPQAYGNTAPGFAAEMRVRELDRLRNTQAQLAIAISRMQGEGGDTTALQGLLEDTTSQIRSLQGAGQAAAPAAPQLSRGEPDDDTIRGYLDRAGNDPEEAKRLARADGWQV